MVVQITLAGHAAATQRRVGVPGQHRIMLEPGAPAPDIAHRISSVRLSRPTSMRRPCCTSIPKISLAAVPSRLGISKNCSRSSARAASPSTAFRWTCGDPREFDRGRRPALTACRPRRDRRRRVGLDTSGADGPPNVRARRWRNQVVYDPDISDPDAHAEAVLRDDRNESSRAANLFVFGFSKHAKHLNEDWRATAGRPAGHVPVNKKRRRSRHRSARIGVHRRETRSPLHHEQADAGTVRRFVACVGSKSALISVSGIGGFESECRIPLGRCSVTVRRIPRLTG